MSKKTIDINPRVTILSVLPHVKYSYWHALAEYVDNAIQSSLDHKEKLDAIYGGEHQLRVDISLNKEKGEIQIIDNSTGISANDFERALRPGEFPPNREGLSEFGMGLKAASCWFSRKWSVETKHFEESLVRTVHFDIDDIIKQNQNLLPYDEKSAGKSKPYTLIRLREVKKMPKGRTVSKIKDYLGDIYRLFIREKSMILTFDGEPLHYESPEILVAPYYQEREGEKKKWKIDVNFSLGEGRRVSGFAALLQKGSRSQSGFSLFRRKRVIEGSGEARYRPKEVFGSASSFESLRIFGELHLSGFDVSYTKDGFNWNESEEDFAYALKRELKKAAGFLEQARNLRVREVAFDNKTLDKAVGAMNDPNLAEAITSIIHSSDNAFDENLRNDEDVCHSAEKYFSYLGWKVKVRFHDTAEPAEWFKVARANTAGGAGNELLVDIFINHWVVIELGGADKKQMEILTKVALAVALTSCAEESIDEGKESDFVRRLNQILPAIIGMK